MILFANESSHGSQDPIKSWSPSPLRSALTPAKRQRMSHRREPARLIHKSEEIYFHPLSKGRDTAVEFFQWQRCSEEEKDECVKDHGLGVLQNGKAWPTWPTENYVWANGMDKLVFFNESANVPANFGNTALEKLCLGESERLPCFPFCIGKSFCVWKF